MSSPNRRVVVDDSDSRIRYIGEGWAQDLTGSHDDFGTYGKTYNHSLHTTTANGSFAFSFEGSSIRVLGTLDLSEAYGGPATVLNDNFRPPWECFIDGISIGSSKPTPYHENNWLLCGNDFLFDGNHELTLNLTLKKGATFWVDQIQYTPSHSPNGTAVTVVENTDKELSYDSTWQGIGGLANMTSTQGANVKFNFTGTQLTWVGYIPVELPGNGSSASYSIDAGPPKSFFLVGHPATDGTSTFNEVFFTTPRLDPGDHSIVVAFDGDQRYTPLTMDYIYLTTSDVSPKSASGQSKHVQAGAIAGGVIGGIVFVIIFILGILLCLRRRRSRADTLSIHSGLTYMTGPSRATLPLQNGVVPFSTYQPSSVSTGPMYSTASVQSQMRGQSRATLPIQTEAVPLSANQPSSASTDPMYSTTTVQSPSTIASGTFDSIGSARGFTSGALAIVGDTKRSPFPFAVDSSPRTERHHHRFPWSREGAVSVIDENPPQYTPHGYT